MKIEKLKVIVVNHYYATGPAENFLEFCIGHKCQKVMSILHPLMYQKDQKGSRWLQYETGDLKKEHERPNKKRSYIIDYFLSSFLNIWWVIKTKEKWDIYVGSNNLNAFCGIVLRWLGKVKKVVYYTIDFVPVRFENKIMNWFYHYIDTFCVKHCDITWNLSPRMVEAREEQLKLPKKYREKQVLVPEGVWFNRIKKYSLDEVNQNSLVFVGHLVLRLGVQKMIEAIPQIKKVIPDIKFIVIGKGEYKEKLEELACQLKVGKELEFKGFIPDHQDVENIISQCAIGIATYAPEKDSLSFFCDPSKTKIYMGCGLPVIMTDMFYNAREIEEAGAGKVVNYTAEEISSAVIEMMSDKEKLLKYKKCAMEYIKDLDWNIIFSKQLQYVFLKH